MNANKGCIAGRGSPEGVVKGELGALYLDVAAGVFYYKQTGQGVEVMATPSPSDE
jgi:hypothetical protein